MAQFLLCIHIAGKLSIFWVTCNQLFKFKTKKCHGAGLSDLLLSKMAKYGKSKTDSHICRNLHQTIKSFGKCLPIQISTVPTTLRLSRRRPTRVSVQHPVLHLSSWAETVFNYGGHFFMQGKDLDSAQQFSNELVD